MNRQYFDLKSLRWTVRRIHLVNKSLLFFMLILLVQSTVSMFLPGDASQLTRDIDVIVRTSAASIFGYFLSASFLRSASGSGQATNGTTSHILETGAERSEETAGAMARIGFTDVEASLESGGTEDQATSVGASAAGSLQIAIAGAIGLFCLIVLLALRNLVQLGFLSAESSSVATAVTQFRDFIAGCVGFLIGSPAHLSEQTS